MKDHLDFNTDFLNNASSKPKVNSSKPTGDSGGSNWKKNLTIAGAIIFVIWGIVTIVDDSISTSSYTPSPTTNTYNQNNEDMVVTGTYLCSQYNHNKAGELEPSKAELANLEAQQSGFAIRTAAISREGDRLDNEYVDEYDQNDIDQHNAAIYAYNASLEKYKRDITANDAAVDSYNARIGIYNNFLITNCTKN